MWREDLLQDESYYLRSLGEDVRKVKYTIVNLLPDVIFPWKLFIAALNFLTGTCWS